MLGKKSKLMICMFICIDIFIILAVGRFSVPYVTLNIDLGVKSAQIIQISYASTDEITAETLTFYDYPLSDPSQGFQKKLKLPNNVRVIRIDLGDIPNEEVRINKMYLQVLNQTYEISDIENPFIINHMQFIGDHTFKCNAEDPYLIYQINGNELYTFWKNTWTERLLLGLIVSFIIDAFIFAMINIGLRQKSVKDLVSNRSIIWNLAKRDFKTKYAGSYLGVFWAFFQPIVTILLYWFVFEVGFRSAPTNGFPFVLWLICGLVPWFMFSDGITAVTSCLLEYNYLVKKVVFNIKMLPLVKMISALFVHLFFILFMFTLFVLNGYGVNLYYFQIAYYLFAMLMLILALGLITSAVVVFFRDLGQIVQILLQIAVWMTPIMWNLSMISTRWQFIFQLNPLYYIVDGYRDCFINQVWFWEKPGLTIYYWIFVIILLSIGIKVFERLRIHFADVL